MGCRQGLFKATHRSLIGILGNVLLHHTNSSDCGSHPGGAERNGKTKNQRKSTKNSGKQERVTELDSCGPSCQQCTEGTEAIHQGEGKPEGRALPASGVLHGSGQNR